MTTTTREAADRIAAYLTRVKGRAGYDQECIHAFDVGREEAVALRVADIVAVLAERDELLAQNMALVAERDAAMAGAVRVKPLEWWCDPCRSVGAMHCSDPENCGFMRTASAQADDWKAWLDDLPLPDDFSQGIDRLQDFIARIMAALDVQPLTVQDAALEPDFSNRVIAFGMGALVIDTGDYAGTPAVFIAPTDKPGPVGGKVVTDRPLDQLISGELVFTFPTAGQAKTVADALVNALEPDPERLAKVRNLIDAAVRLNDACDAMWNDHERLEPNPASFGQKWRLKDAHMKAISEAQQALPSAITALKGGAK